MKVSEQKISQYHIQFQVDLNSIFLTSFSNDVI